ncbi:hypothetical protein AKJ51_03115 [candidate division MSBL1 archaeon SCGC-AAA382A20]|uniref:Flavodoxin-like domain-containing protein n=1 Tax=candidate division MSBL1 archaeon SCGC-AAA382A20 TaxID=1698280 RepID=A0A133VJV0_9EURY|nr:hypothetical protein AKJ51_03115 [candidate division MSBL1 archaeon SCGC-AAA382A20]
MHETIKSNIHWVGAVDWNARKFHGYRTIYGTTYNSYVIDDEKVALIDAVKKGFENQLFDRLEHAGVENVDYLVVNHIEMDHASGVETVLERFPEARIVTNERGKKGLEDAYGIQRDAQIVDTGDELNLGEKTLTFVRTPMVHWPDSMATYAVEDNVLLPNDAFGLHYASKKRFDDEFTEEEMGRIFYEAAKYYANIVLVYSKQVQGVLNKIEDLGIDIDVIAPSHGIIWRKRIPEILERYKAWSSGDAEDKVTIIYDSMWGHTKEAAMEVAKGIDDREVDYRLYNLENSDWTEVMAEVMLSKGIIVGSPTLNGEIYPEVAGFLTYMKGLEPFDKTAAAFGSYGWSGEAVGKIINIFDELGFDTAGKTKWIFDADEDTMSDLRELGREVADKIKP